MNDRDRLDDQADAQVDVRFDEPAEDFELDSAVVDGEAWSTSRDADPTSPAQRVDQAQVVLTVLRAFLGGSRRLAPIEDDVQRTAEKIARSIGLDERARDHTKLAEEIEEALVSIETALAELERKIPPSWLRRRFDEHAFDDRTIAHYLRYQLQNLEATPECWSRIDLLVTRMVRRAQPDGSYVIKPPAEVAALWQDCLPSSQTDDHVRKAAINFFRNAAKRLEEFKDADELFSSGYYVDVAGYKISLRLAYFDPPVLYAAAELNIALRNWLQAHEAAGRDLRALDKEFAQAHDTIRKIFVGQYQDFEAVARFRARMFGTARPEAPATDVDIGGAVWQPPVQGKKLARKLAIAAAAVAALAVALPLALTITKERRRDLQPMGRAEAMEFHSMLTDASLGGEPASLLVGELDSSSWVLLSAQQRRHQVDVLVRALRSRELDSALIYREGILAIHIVGGQVRYIE